jgi:hypothetical protein
MKYRPEDKKEKAERLKGEAAAREAGKVNRVPGSAASRMAAAAAPVGSGTLAQAEQRGGRCAACG